AVAGVVHALADEDDVGAAGCATNGDVVSAVKVKAPGEDVGAVCEQNRVAILQIAHRSLQLRFGCYVDDACAANRQRWRVARRGPARRQKKHHRWTQMNTDFTEAKQRRRRGASRAEKTRQQDFTAETRRPQRKAEMPGKTENVNRERRKTLG